MESWKWKQKWKRKRNTEYVKEGSTADCFEKNYISNNNILIKM